MYPRPFEYMRPESVDEALAALAGSGEALVLAGGQSLVPMMSLGLAAPELLVDLARLPLAGSESGVGSVRLGALTRHRELERSAELAVSVPLASEAARFIGNPRVRNRGTLGGSLSHADPASELGTVALAYGGRAVIADLGGERKFDFDEFFHGFFETAVGEGELLTAVELDVPAAGSGYGFHEVAGRADDFAIAVAAAVVILDEAGTACADARLALAGVGDDRYGSRPGSRSAAVPPSTSRCSTGLPWRSPTLSRPRTTPSSPPPTGRGPPGSARRGRWRAPGAGPGSRMTVAFTLTGVPQRLDAPLHCTRLRMLRDAAGRTDAKHGCGEGVCGACAVLVDGVAMNSCSVLAPQVEGASIETVAGLANGESSIRSRPKWSGAGSSSADSVRRGWS